MSRRALAFLVGVVVVSVLVAVTELISVPYVVLDRGPAVTPGCDGGEPVVQVEGHQTYPTDGHLDQVTDNAYGGPGGSPGSLDRPGCVAEPRRQRHSAGRIPFGRATARAGDEP